MGSDLESNDEVTHFPHSLAVQSHRDNQRDILYNCDLLQDAGEALSFSRAAPSTQMAAPYVLPSTSGSKSRACALDNVHDDAFLVRTRLLELGWMKDPEER